MVVKGQSHLKFLIFFILLGALQASPCLAQTSREALVSEYQSVSDDPERNNKFDEWVKVAQSLSLTSQSEGENAPTALYYAGLSFERAARLSEDPAHGDEAMNRYVQLTSKYPTSDLADDGYFRIARIYETKGDVDAAKKSYGIILKSYPKSEMVELSKSRIKQIGKPAKINSIKSWSGPDYTRIVLDVDGLNTYMAKSLPADPEHNKSPRVFLDVKNSVLGPKCPKTLTIKDGAVTGARLAQHDPKTVRIVLDLSYPSTYRVFPLLSPSRMVLDIYREVDPKGTDLVAELIRKAAKEPSAVASEEIWESGKCAPPTLEPKKAEPAPVVVAPLVAPVTPPVVVASIPPLAIPVIPEKIEPKAEPSKPVEQVLVPKEIKEPPKTPEEVKPPCEEKPAKIEDKKPDSKKETALAKYKKLKIVLDAGHGGTDPGAIGVGNVMEKDMTLAIVKKLEKKLKDKLNCDIKLTRSEDVFVTLSNRTAIANAYGADIFLSVHVNASPIKSASGIETYYLDRASDRSARRVAALENRTNEDGVLETEEILADVLLNMKLPESKQLANNIQEAMLKRIAKNHGPVRNLGVKRAPFYVLTGAVMPAVLIEAGFITNKNDAKWIKSSAFQETVADSVTAALLNYAEKI